MTYSSRNPRGPWTCFPRPHIGFRSARRRVTHRNKVTRAQERATYKVTDRLHRGRTVCVPGDHIAATVSAWLAELEVRSPLVEDLARAVTAADWPAVYDIGDLLAVSVEVAVPA